MRDGVYWIISKTDKVIEIAINQAGWAIKYAKNPSEELQLLAVRKIMIR